MIIGVSMEVTSDWCRLTMTHVFIWKIIGYEQSDEFYTLGVQFSDYLKIHGAKLDTYTSIVLDRLPLVMYY